MGFWLFLTRIHEYTAFRQLVGPKTAKFPSFARLSLYSCVRYEISKENGPQSLFPQVYESAAQYSQNNTTLARF